jgi:DNA-binding NtrC family response regulator
MALHVLDRVNATLRGRNDCHQVPCEAANHAWPGNVRDLENVIERSARLARQDVLDADDLMISEPVTYADPLAALPEPRAGFS